MNESTLPPWLPLIPSHWQVERAGRVARHVHRSPDGATGVVTAFRDGEVTLRSNRRIDGFTEAIKETGYQGVRRGDLVIHSMDGFAGAIGVSDSDGKMSPVVHIYRTEYDNPHFIAQSLRVAASSGFIQSLAKGIRERSTSFDNAMFKSMLIPRPPKTEQDLIIAFLDRETARIDTLIKEQQRLIDLLRERRKSVIVHSISEGLDPTASFMNTEVNWIDRMPKDWSVKRFAHMIAASNAGEVIDKSWWGEGSEVLFTCARESISSNYTQFPEEKRTQNNDILITRNATPYIHMPRPGAIYSNVVQRVTLRPTINKHWMKYALEAATGAMHGDGVSIDTFNFGMWKSLNLPVPPLQEQCGIVAYLDEQTSIIGHLMLESDRLIALARERRSALIAAAVTGQIDVRDEVA